MQALSYSPDNYTPYSYREIALSPDGRALPLNVYTPTVINAFNQTAVVCIHGGAWTSILEKNGEWKGSWMRHHASLLASLGYYAVEITHRSIAETTINGVISDVETAFKTVKRVIMPRHSLTRLFALGDSAGGHLALMSAILPDTEIRPEKVVACNPVSDLTDAKWQLGGSTYDERRDASPLYRSDKTETDILVLHGDSDQTVDVSYSYKLAEHLRSIGNKCRFDVLTGAAHAFILYGYKTPTEKVNEYMEMALDFLAK